MTTRRVPPATQSYQQRAKERKAVDYQKQREAQQQRHEAKLAALHAPPAPPPMTFDQRQAQRKSEDEGRRQAAEKAEREAAANAPPRNPYRVRAGELEGKLYRPENQKRHAEFLRLADQWDQEQAAAQEAAAKQAAIDNDPYVKNARDYAAGLVKLAPEEFQSEAAEINGISQAGDAQLAWQRMRELEQRIWAHQDKVAADKRASKATTDQEFQEAATRAQEARERAEHASNMANELNPSEEQ